MDKFCTSVLYKSGNGHWYTASPHTRPRVHTHKYIQYVHTHERRKVRGSFPSSPSPRYWLGGRWCAFTRLRPWPYVGCPHEGRIDGRTVCRPSCVPMISSLALGVALGFEIAACHGTRENLMIFRWFFDRRLFWQDERRIV